MVVHNGPSDPWHGSVRGQHQWSTRQLTSLVHCPGWGVAQSNRATGHWQQGAGQQGTGHRVQGTGHRAQGTGHRAVGHCTAPGTRHPAPAHGRGRMGCGGSKSAVRPKFEDVERRVSAKSAVSSIGSGTVEPYIPDDLVGAIFVGSVSAGPACPVLGVAVSCGPACPVFGVAHSSKPPYVRASGNS